MRRPFLAVCLILLGALIVGCKEDKEEKEDEAMSRSLPQTARQAEGWEAKFTAALPALGHRNWVVVADAAFPLQISPGMEVVVSNEDHFAVLDKVLKALGETKHVRPKIYVDKELDFVPEELAPGMDACRKRLKDMLVKFDARPILHEELIARMDQVARTFRILMIKTNLTVPYTTVFMELDCGYWGPDSEAKMREKMK
jgi:hypothetical protein